MTQFFRMLPTLLERTDVFLDLRDARLPLTSVSSTQNAHGNQVRGIILLYVSSNSQTVTSQYYDAMQTSPHHFTFVQYG